MLKTNRWILLFLSCLLMLAFALTLQAPPPLFKFISKEIAITNSRAGFLMGLYAIPGIFLPFLIPLLKKKFTAKSLIIWALAFMLIGQLSYNFATSFIMLVIFRLLIGIGATIIVVLTPLLVSISFTGDKLGTAMGIFNISVPAGSVIAANFFGLFALQVGWRGVMNILGIYVFLIMIISFFFLSSKIEEKEGQEKASVERDTCRVCLSSLVVIWALANAQLLAYMTFAPDYFNSLNLASKNSNFLTSLIMFVPIIMSPVFGLLFDKTGKEFLYIVFGNLINLFSFIMLGNGKLGLLTWAILIGIGYSAIPVYVFSILPEVTSSKDLPMALGLTTMASNIGITIGPILIGELLDLFNNDYRVSFWIYGFISALIIGFTFTVSRKRKNI